MKRAIRKWRGTFSTKRAWFVGVVLFVAVPSLACSSEQTLLTDSPELAAYNAYWNCPSATPLPIATPEPTRCWQPPGPSPLPGAPTQQPLCTDPQPTATPMPSATPYGRQMLPGARSTTTFYLGQGVRIGALRVALTRYFTIDIPSTPGSNEAAAHVWELETANEGAETLTVTWPLRVMVREIRTLGGEAASGLWGYSERAASAAGATW